MLQWVNARSGRVSILNLHRVTPVENPYWPAMPPGAFERLVAYLARHCRVIGLGELGSVLPSGVPSVVLSFDDGCRDFVDYAMPILAARRLRVNHNVIVSSVTSGQPPWMVKVVDALHAAGPAAVRELRVPGFAGSLADDRFSRGRFGAQLTGFLKALAIDDREPAFAALDRLIACTDPADFTPMMSQADVLEAANHHDIGCHSYSHESMALVTDAEFGDDLARCRAFFGEVGLPLDTYAFPYGSHRTSQVDLLRRAGVDRILVVGETPARPSSPMLSRITMYGDSDAELQMRATGRAVRPPAVTQE